MPIRSLPFAKDADSNAILC